jgi:hypothetical protein
MLESALKLSVPSALALAFHLKFHGAAWLRDLKSDGISRLVALAVFLLHVVALLVLGKDWFCGQCHHRQEMVVFLMPGIGYSLAIFPVSLSSVLYSKDEFLDERVSALFGWFLIASGWLSVFLFSG